MHQIKYILVNDSTAKGGVCKSSHRFIPHIGHCVEVDAGFRFQDAGSRCSGGSKDLEHETWNLEQRATLVSELIRLRRHWPDAKILGMSELDTSGSHAPVRVSEVMNRLRRELSEQREQSQVCLSYVES